MRRPRPIQVRRRTARRVAGSASVQAASPTRPDPIDRDPLPDVPGLGHAVAAGANPVQATVRRGGRTEAAINGEERRAAREANGPAGSDPAAGRGANRTGPPTGGRRTIDPSRAGDSSATGQVSPEGRSVGIAGRSRAGARTDRPSIAQIDPRSTARTGRPTTDLPAPGLAAPEPPAPVRQLRALARPTPALARAPVRARRGQVRPAGMRLPNTRIGARRRQRTTCSARARSSLPAAARSRRHSSRGDPQFGCSSSRSDARHWSVSSCMPRACASRSSRLRAAR